MRRTRRCFALAMMASSLSQGAWVNTTANLAGNASACGNVFCLIAVPGQDKIIAGISGNQGLFATTDNGATWLPMGVSTSWVDAGNILFEKANPEVFWETGIHGGLTHKTVDGGKTFAMISGAGGGDGIGIDMSDPLRKTVVVGAH